MSAVMGPCLRRDDGRLLNEQYNFLERLCSHDQTVGVPPLAPTFQMMP
ncbi:MAG TPA: hypothetical protein VFK01_16955 [Bradyrhizobium sp.]|nr:hypothetical protein [Bradyrhizobium sp.]